MTSRFSSTQQPQWCTYVFFIALATDYDGTLALHGQVDDLTCKALEEVRSSGRKLILVTGRDLLDLQRVFSQLDLFDLVVAENGALLFDPAKKEEIPLAEPPPEALVKRLRERGVSPLAVGRTIIATWEPNEGVVLEAIRISRLNSTSSSTRAPSWCCPAMSTKRPG